MTIKRVGEPIPKAKMKELMDELLYRLGDKMMDEGYILKLLYDMGEINLVATENYEFQNKIYDWEKMNSDPKHKRRYKNISKIQYYFMWHKGKTPKARLYFVRISEDLNKRLHDRLMKGEKVFSYERKKK